MVFRFDANEHKQSAIWLHSTICNIHNNNDYSMSDNKAYLKLYADTYLLASTVTDTSS